MKISDYLESNVLSVLIRDIEYLQSAIHDSEKAAEDLFAVRAKNKELLTETLDLRDKLLDLIELTGTW